MTQSDTFRSMGIYHIHSDFSYDGNNSLREIAAWGKSQGLNFILLTEHDLGFDQAKFEEFCTQCASNSDDVLLVPGIEYEVIHHGAKIHIGAIGVPVLIDRVIIGQGLSVLIDAIHNLGGLAVLHHPDNVKNVLTRKILDSFDFVELWNTKFDCSFAPNHRFLRWLQGFDFAGPYLVSADIHDVSRFKQSNIAFIFMEGMPQLLQAAAIIDSLRQRRYRCHYGSWDVSPHGTYEVPNRLYRFLPWVCLVKKKLYRCAKYCIPKKYRKKLFDLVR